MTNSEPIKGFDLLSITPPEMPAKLPGFVRDAICKVPLHMRMAAANALFPPAEALMHNVTFRYWDNTTSEPNGMEGCVGPSAVGKGYLDSMIEAIIRKLRAHDEESQRKLQEYARICKTKGQNKDKPERPTDAAILVPEPDMTNPALIQLLQDAEREGNRSLYTTMPEVDLLDQCAGGHRKVTKVIRLNFDSKRYGAQRATIEGITGNPFLLWKFNFSCVEDKARSFFKGGLLDGTLGRIGISLVQKPQKRQLPKQGNYDQAYFDKLDEYLLRLSSANGLYNITQLNRLILSMNDEMNEIADLSDDDIFESLAHRSLRIAWMKGCVLYIAEGYRWTRQIQDFVVWSLYYDLWSKLSIFAPQMKNARNNEMVDVRKYGPSNMLDLLPDSFAQQQLEQLRESQNKKAYCRSQLDNWMDRQYITYDESTKLYTKTEEYKKRHPQNNLD